MANLNRNQEALTQMLMNQTKNDMRAQTNPLQNMASDMGYLNGNQNMITQPRNNFFKPVGDALKNLGGRVLVGAGLKDSQAEIRAQQLLADREAYIQSQSPEIQATLRAMAPSSLDTMMRSQVTTAIDNASGDVMEGTGIVAQYTNVLNRGVNDLAVRNSPLYKQAYNYMTKDTTEEYVNKQGRKVIRTIPGLGAGVYPNPYTEAPLVDETNVESDVDNIDATSDPSSQKIQEEVIVVTAEDRKQHSKNLRVLGAAEDKVSDFRRKIIALDPGPLTFGVNRSVIDSGYTSLLLELKNFAELGVLAGPDLDLLQSMIGDPTGFIQTMLKGGSEGVLAQLDELQDMVNTSRDRSYENVNEARPVREKNEFKNGRWINTETGTDISAIDPKNGREVRPDKDQVWRYTDNNQRYE